MLNGSDDLRYRVRLKNINLLQHLTIRYKPFKADKALLSYFKLQLEGL